MHVNVHLYATLAKFLPADATDKTCQLEFKQDATVSDIIHQLGIPEKSVKLIFVNGVHAAKNQPLKDGDRVGLFPPVGGG
ncbi:MAG TPA: MoaD/ThiS family protein [Desulfosalsimonadaceae bacterium]|nr:MoaD/ThiS family protein [Desulfosalsimonadaceae bacterium]